MVLSLQPFELEKPETVWLVGHGIRIGLGFVSNVRFWCGLRFLGMRNFGVADGLVGRERKGGSDFGGLRLPGRQWRDCRLYWLRLNYGSPQLLHSDALNPPGWVSCGQISHAPRPAGTL